MSQAQTLARKIVWVVARAAALGVSLAAVFPTAGVKAECDCHDYGTGKWTCNTGTESFCSLGSQTCDVTCS
jgi:hypothetical protein